jgi:hypothetical protein
MRHLDGCTGRNDSTNQRSFLASESSDYWDSVDEWRQSMPVLVHHLPLKDQLKAHQSVPRSAPKARPESSPLSGFSFFKPNSRTQTYPRFSISRRRRTRTLLVPQMRPTSLSPRLGCASAWSAILPGTSLSVIASPSVAVR